MLTETTLHQHFHHVIACRPRFRLDKERVVYCGIERCFFEVTIRGGIFRYTMSKRVVTTDSNKELPPCPPNLGAIMDKMRNSFGTSQRGLSGQRSARATAASTTGARLETQPSNALPAAPSLPSASGAADAPNASTGVTPAPAGRVTCVGVPLAGHHLLAPEQKSTQEAAADAVAAVEGDSLDAPAEGSAAQQPAAPVLDIVEAPDSGKLTAAVAAPVGRIDTQPSSSSTGVQDVSSSQDGPAKLSVTTGGPGLLTQSLSSMPSLPQVSAPCSCVSRVSALELRNICERDTGALLNVGS